MTYNKRIETKYLVLNVTIVHTGLNNHERINASVDSIADFNSIVEHTMSYFYNHIKSWEQEHRAKIEQVGI